MKNLLRLFFIFWMVIPILSQNLDSTRSLPAPRLVATGDPPGEPLILTRFCAEVTINGMIAETKITLTFFNPHNRIVEGDFNFPLPEGSFVSGYALDINGVMVDGVVVEKQKGRMVFEKIVRQGIDPGLVEWVEGNNFRTRIFPIPAKGTRTVSVRYLSEIVFKDQQPFFYLPLHFKKEIKDFSLRVEVVQTDQEPGVLGGRPGNFQFSRWKSGFMAETALKNYLPAEDLIIRLPQTSQQNVRLEQDSEGHYYFSIHHWIEKSSLMEVDKPIEPGYITILWDASGSMGKYNLRKELQILESYFSSLKKKPITVDLVLFHHKREKSRRFTVNKNNIGSLIRAIAGIEYDGGTSLAALSPPAKELPPDLYLLFSDGRSNFDNLEPTGFKAPVYAFSGSSLANHAFLRYITRQSGGMYFNLNTTDQEMILKKMGKSPYSFISVTVDSGSVSGLFPQTSQPVYDSFSIAGKLLSPQAKITLNYGFSGKILNRVSFKISRKEAIKGNRMRTFWAQKKIAYLQIFPGRRQELVETGKKYGLVTPGTSLIVLDNLEQYLEHKIMPPKSLPKIRQQYLHRIKQQDKKIREKKKKKLDYLVKAWNKRVEWWKTSYPVAPEKSKEKTGSRTSTFRARAVRTTPVQSFRGIREQSQRCIFGKVVLEDGLGIPGIMVTLTQRESNSHRTTVTNEQGDYVFADIPVGVYDLKAELEGFRTTLIQGIRLRQRDKLEIGILMYTCVLAEEITVTASGGEDARTWNIDGANVTDSSAVGAAPAYLNYTHVKESASETGEKSAAGPTVAIKEWNPKTPYLEALKKAAPGNAYTVYIKQGKKYGNAPSFYLDCADYFFKIGKKETGLRVLSNIAEMDMENPALLRVLGHRLAQLQYLEPASIIFEKVLELRPEEPHSYRDLALVLAGMKKYEQAVDLLVHVIYHQWDDRFEEIEMIVLMELNNLLEKARNDGCKGLKKKPDPRLCKLLDVDIRIVLTWDADMTDMDLYVIDPRGEESYYGNNLSHIGGLMSRDFTRGYGPEEYVLKKAIKGEYKIKVNYFGSSAVKFLGAITLQVDIFTDYGRKTEKRKSITLRLKKQKEVIDVGSIEF